MTEKAPIVSVVIPTYNRAHLVGRAIRSVLDQTYQHLEIIVVDDASSDNTEEVVTSSDDLRIRYIRRDENGGGSAARNTGIRAARGEYIAFLDSDDEWLPEKLAHQVKILTEDPSCGAVYTDIIIICSDGSMRVIAGYHCEGEILKELLVQNVAGTSSSVVVRRQCLVQAGLFDEGLPSCQDWDMWIRIAKHCRFRKASVPLVYYFEHGARITSNLKAVVLGHEAVSAKHRAERRRFGRCVEAAHQFSLGIRLYHVGATRVGRHHLLAAVVEVPCHPRYLVFALASLFGASVFRGLKKLERLVVRSRGVGSIRRNSLFAARQTTRRKE